MLVGHVSNYIRFNKHRSFSTRKKRIIYILTYLQSGNNSRSFTVSKLLYDTKRRLTRPFLGDYVLSSPSQQGFKRNWFILRSLISKDFKLKYRRSALGVLWSVLNPLLMMCVLSAVFSFMFRFDIDNFPLYLIIGSTLFTLMGDATTTAMNSIMDSSSLIKKVKIEKILFPLEKVLFQVVNYCLSLIAVAAVMIYFQVIPTWNIVFLPLLLFYIILFSTGLSFLLSALVVFFRDIAHLWSVVITAWTYATPLFYPISILPDWMQSIMNFNPMYHYVTYLREIMLWGQTPSLQENLLCLGMGVIALALGYLVFRKLEKKFILYV